MIGVLSEYIETDVGVMRTSWRGSVYLQLSSYLPNIRTILGLTELYSLRVAHYNKRDLDRHWKLIFDVSGSRAASRDFAHTKNIRQASGQLSCWSQMTHLAQSSASIRTR